MLSMTALARRLFVRPRPQSAPRGVRLGAEFHVLEERVTPDVKVYTNATLTTLVNTYTGAGALTAAVNAGTTLDGYFVVADTTGTSSYTSPGLIPKSLTLLGPNAAIDPNTGSRVAEVNIDTTAEPLRIASGKAVSVRGFSFSTPGGKGALTTFATGYSADFSFNVVSGQVPVYRDVYVDSNGGPGYTAATITHNRIDKTGDPNHAAVRLGTGSNGVVSDNVILGGFTGVQLDSQDLPSGTNNALVTNNYISGTTNEAVQVANEVNNATVTYNTIVNANTLNVVQRGGIRVYGNYLADPAAPGPGGSLVIANNLISASNNGIFFSDGNYPPNLTALSISQNLITVNAGTDMYNTGNVNDAPPFPVIDLSGNYFGTTNPATIETRIAGTRAATVGAYLDGGVNSRTAALSTSSGLWGFEPDLSAVNMVVPQTATTSGLAVVDGKIQTGVTRASAGMTVLIAGDTFPENVTTTRDVKLVATAPVVIAPGAGNALTVNGGTTLLTGTFAAGTAPAVVNAGTLGGTATYANALTVNSAGTVNPGDGGTAVGTLTVTGLTYDGGTYAADFLAGSSDTILVSGAVDLNGGTPGVFVINSQSGTASPGNVFTLINHTGAGPIADPPLTNAPEGASVTVNGLTGTYTYAGGNGRSFTITSAGPVNVSGAGPMEVRMVSPAPGQYNVQFLVNNVIADSRPLASIVGMYTVTGSPGNDTLLVNYTTTAPAVGYFQRDITYNGNGGTDGLTVDGGGFGRVGFTPSSAAAGTIRQYSDAAGTSLLSSIAFSSVPAMTDTSATQVAAFALPGGTVTLGDDAAAAAGQSQLAATGTPTTSFANPAQQLVVGVAAASAVTLNAMDAGFDPSAGVLVAGSAGNDTVTVNWVASQPVTVAGGGVAAGGADQVNINAGTTPGAPGTAGAGAVLLTDAGPGTDNFRVTVTGTGTGDVIDVNDLNTGAYAGASAPFAAIATAQGPATVAVNGTKVLAYGPANGGTSNLSLLTFAETAGTNTFNVQYTDAGTAGSLLPASVVLNTTTGLDTLNLIGTTGQDAVDVNQTAAGVAAALGSAVTYNPAGAAFIATVNVYGRDEAGLTGDTFQVKPDADAAINIYAGLPTAFGFGDTLVLNAVGLTNPALTDLGGGQPPYPDGKITSTNRKTVTWRSIETLPVPLGLGGTFDFQPTRTVADPNAQPGFLPVLPSDTPTTGPYAGAAGWLSPGAGAYNRLTQYGAGGEPNSPQLARLFRDGEWGYAGGGTKNGRFQVAVAPNQDVEVTVFVGDTYAARDNMNVYVGTSAAGPFTKLNPALGTLNTATGQVASYSGVFNPGNNAQLVVVFEATGTGASAYWTVSGIDVRPVGLIAPLALSRVGGDAAVLADGLTVDTYTGSGAAPGAELTISPQYGTVTATSTAGGSLVAGDRDAAVKGAQAVADANGNFSFSVRRSTGAGPALVTVTDVTGASGTGVITPTDVQPSGAAPFGYGGSGLPVPASPPPTPAGYTYQNGYVLPSRYFQFYDLPEVRRIDFGPATSQVASDFDPYQSSYLGWGNGAFVSKEANALGWVGTPPSLADRGAGSALQRDLAYGPATAPADYLLYTPRANADYAVTVTVGDMGFPRDNQFVLNVDPSNPNSATTLASGISTKAGEVTSLTFTVTSDAQGRIRLRFGAANGVSTYWAVEGVEVRPVIAAVPQTGQQRPVTLNGQAYSTAPAPTLLATSYVADGTTPTSYSITGATPNSVLTVTATFVTPSAPNNTPLAVGTTDASTSYTGFQVVATAGGAASFTVARPSYPQAAYAVITVTDVTGAQVGVFRQDYTGGTLPPPPPPATSVQRFDFNTAGSPTLSGFTGVTNATVYSSAQGYGWQDAVLGYDRGAAAASGAGANAALFQDGATRSGGFAGTFQVAVPNGGVSRDVRVYVGDPSTAPAETVTVEGAGAIPVDTILNKYGFITATATDANNDGVITIAFNGTNWVAAGVDVATPGSLPAPAAATAPALPLRVDFNGPANDTVAGFTGVRAATVYSPAAGYGWRNAGSRSEFERTAASVSNLTSANPRLYRDGVWGTSAATFGVGVVPLSQNSLRVYLGDSYGKWPNVTLAVEGGVSASTGANPNQFYTYLLTGTDTNGDGVLTLTVSGSTWVINGIDAVAGPQSNLPANTYGPAGSPQLPAGGAVPGGAAAVLTADQLAPVAAEAVRRWAATGLSPDQVALLRSVTFPVGDIATGELGLTELGGTVVRLDDDGAGRGWFVDATPGDDAEFGFAVGPTEFAATDPRAAGTYDLLTVVMHEMGHTLGLDSLDPAAAPRVLLTATLAAGVRRLPAPAEAAPTWLAVEPTAAPVMRADAAPAPTPLARLIGPAAPAVAPVLAPARLADGSAWWLAPAADRDDFVLPGVMVG